MKTCSKCGRSYPDHVDFCLRDGHPLVAQAGEEPEAPTPSAPVEAPKGRGGVPIDLQATTDVFLPNLRASLLGGDGGEDDADLPDTAAATTPPEPIPESDTHATEEIAPVVSKANPEDAEEVQEPSAIDPDSDLLATDIISVSRVRQVVARQREGQPISLINPMAMDPEAMVQTDLIPRNWRGQLEEAGQLPAEMTTTDPKGKGVEVTASGPDLSLSADPSKGEASEESDTDPQGHQAAGPSPQAEPDPTPSEEIEALLKTGSVSRAAMSMPFVFDGDGDGLEGIPSGFEDSAPPEDGDVENTGLLSRSFIQRTIQESAQATAPWEGEEKEDQPFVPRGERGEEVPALEEGELHKGIAPPKGSFRKRAAFSHWPSSASGEESESEAEEELAELGAAFIETGEMKTPPPAAPEGDPWNDAAASSTVMTQAHPQDGEVPLPPQSGTQSRGWIWAALAVLVIGGGAVLGLTMNKSEPAPMEPPVRVEATEGAGQKVGEGRTQGVAQKSPSIDISKSAPIPLGEDSTPAPGKAEGGKPASATDAGQGEASFGGEAPVAVAAAPKASTPAAPKVGTLKVQVSPAGAQVYINGAAKGDAPRTVKLPAGRHTLRVEQSGYEPAEQQVTIRAGGAEQVKVALKAIPRATPRPTKMRVIITSNVQGAEVFVDGKSVGKTPATAQLREGSRNIKVVAPGKDPYVQGLDIPRSTDPGSFKRVHAQF